ncbi:hypothetical protein M427DRAFT_429169 [Gonapodya prolifera JEL478]|uniref:Uncharacterized protein n=1 Tax=Gonapodya prolifera (strain JEL478) TaxID=1344416 RepID=A0A139ASN9_GONPJ|nr:hypothetical protein M427DRAFT_429169 [Gonapodya prolifera JEL478]|eukprot:KXS19756.1 hypothetical protein M427DRAFT_429169 [Gonapodya prolifera JEL478]
MTEQQREAWKRVDDAMVLVESIVQARRNPAIAPISPDGSAGSSDKTAVTQRSKGDVVDGRSLSNQIVGGAENASTDSSVGEFADLLAVIERLISLAPLANQTVFLTDRQQRGIAIGRLWDRLVRGQMVDQRATMPDRLAQTQQLGPLVQQLNLSASRRFLDQTYQMSEEKEKRIQLARVNDACDRMGRQRMMNQDAHEPLRRRRNSTV